MARQEDILERMHAPQGMCNVLPHSEAVPFVRICVEFGREVS